MTDGLSFQPGKKNEGQTSCGKACAVILSSEQQIANRDPSLFIYTQTDKVGNFTISST